MEKKKQENSDSANPTDVLKKLESLMSKEEIKLSGDYNNSQKEDKSSDSLNYDDGDVLNLQHKVDHEKEQNDERKDPDLSSLINGQVAEGGDTFSDVSEDREELSYDFNQEPEIEDDNSSEAWQDAIKQELKDFDSDTGEDDEQGNEIEDIGSSFNRVENTTDLDRDFGLEEKGDVEHEMPEPTEHNMGFSLGVEQEVQNIFDYDEEQNHADYEQEDHYDYEETEQDGDYRYDQAHEDEYDEAHSEYEQEEEDIISSDVYDETKEMLDQFKDKVGSSSPLGREYQNENLEDFMVKIMKPMLKDWLDANLPKLVKSVVQKEIKKLVD